LSVTEKLGGYASVAASAGRSAGAATLKSRTALVDAVGRLVDAAVERVLLSDDRVTSAADGKLRLSGQTGTEELADKVQRVVVLATPFVRAAARGEAHKAPVGHDRVELVLGRGRCSHRRP